MCSIQKLQLIAQSDWYGMQTTDFARHICTTEPNGKSTSRIIEELYQAFHNLKNYHSDLTTAAA